MEVPTAFASRPSVFIASALLAATTLVSPGGRADVRADTSVPLGQVLSIEALPDGDADLCELPVGAAPASRTAFATFEDGQRTVPSRTGSNEAISAVLAERPPLRTIADPYYAFAGVAVDPVRNEVVLADENVSALIVYDRLTNTPPNIPRSEPKRAIEGDKTFIEYASSVYIDPDNGDIYGINNDTENWMPVFGRDANGNVAPKSALATPHTTAGIAVDEARRELFMTIQDDSAVVVFDKFARHPGPPVEGRGGRSASGPVPGPKRILQGSRTGMADPHGIALDPKRGEIFVVNWGLGNERPALTEQGIGGAGNNRPDFPVSRNRAFPASGKIRPPSITVYAKDAKGDAPPLRVIQGPRTRLNWATSLAVHPDRGELFVANDVGDEVTVFRTDASGDVAPLRVLKGPRSLIKNPNGVAVDLKNNELWVANFGNHSATVYPIDASGDAAPLRVIRSAPIGTPATMLSNPHTVAYDSKREQILAANCVGHPGLVAFARMADGGMKPLREIVGQNTLISRTVHDMAYDPVHDEVVVPSFYIFGILTFRGDANGDVAPIRKIFGPSTQLKVVEALAVDPVHGEIFVPQGERVLVFSRETDGDAAPIRILGGADTGIRGLGRVAVDPVNNVLITAGGGGFRLFDRTASGNAKPLGTIAGTGTALMATYPPRGLFLAATGRGDRHDAEDYIGVWSIHDRGDVPARWTIGKGLFRDIRGIAIDPKTKTVIASDKNLNAVVTFYAPEIFDGPKTGPATR
jgi:DNA-binding beta-propeller fold protein YncE